MDVSTPPEPVLIAPDRPASPGSQSGPGGSSLEAFRREEEARQRLWGRSLVVGGTFGVGAPAGMVGLVAQLNPSPRWGVSWGAGVGGIGPAIASTLWVRPISPTGEWTPALGAGLSVNLTPSEQRALTDRTVPTAARWLNLEFASDWRVLSGRSLRLGVGHAFLLNGGSFSCRPGGTGSCLAASESNVPGWAPYGGGSVGVRDLLVAHGQDRLVHLWFLHLDFGAIVPF